MKKTISFFLCLVMAVSLLSVTAFAQAGLTNFQKTHTYKNGQYSDVASGDWFNTNVSAAYEYGLMQGQSSNSFGAASNVKLSEVIAMAARLNSIYTTGKADFTASTPWYQTYLDYAVENGIISKGRFENYELYATRYQVADIFAAALPVSALPMINNISVGQIPDVSLDTPYQCVYTLYCAGVLTGKTTAGAFGPSDNVLRSEIAAIVTRMADSSLRVKFTIDTSSQSGNAGTINISSQAELLTAVNNARQYSALASEYITTAYTAALAGYDTTALAALDKANEDILAAGKYAQAAAAFCKSNTKYSGAYDDTYNSYLACLEASTQIKTIAKTPLDADYITAKTLATGCGEALSRAYNTIDALK